MCGGILCGDILCYMVIYGVMISHGIRRGVFYYGVCVHLVIYQKGEAKLIQPDELRKWAYIYDVHMCNEGEEILKELYIHFTLYPHHRD